MLDYRIRKNDIKLTIMKLIHLASVACYAIEIPIPSRWSGKIEQRDVMAFRAVAHRLPKGLSAADI